MRIEDVVVGGLYKYDYWNDGSRIVLIKVVRINTYKGRTRVYGIEVDGSDQVIGRIEEIPKCRIVDKPYHLCDTGYANSFVPVDDFVNWIRSVRSEAGIDDTDTSNV